MPASDAKALGHHPKRVGSVLCCTRCGAYSDAATRGRKSGLASPCGGLPRTTTTRTQRTRFLRGRHPSRNTLLIGLASHLVNSAAGRGVTARPLFPSRMPCGIAGCVRVRVCSVGGLWNLDDGLLSLACNIMCFHHSAHVVSWLHSTSEASPPPPLHALLGMSGIVRVALSPELDDEGHEIGADWENDGGRPDSPSPLPSSTGPSPQTRRARLVSVVHGHEHTRRARSESPVARRSRSVSPSEPPRHLLRSGVQVRRDARRAEKSRLRRVQRAKQGQWHGAIPAATHSQGSAARTDKRKVRRARGARVAPAAGDDKERPVRRRGAEHRGAESSRKRREKFAPPAAAARPRQPSPPPAIADEDDQQDGWGGASHAEGVVFTSRARSKFVKARSMSTQTCDADWAA
jgi:hypothetical protein